MKVEEVDAADRSGTLLAGAQFMDAYRLDVDGQTSMRARPRCG
jgi:hypothetical protein